MPQGTDSLPQGTDSLAQFLVVRKGEIMDSKKKNILKEIKSWLVSILSSLILVIVFIFIAKILIEYSGMYLWEDLKNECVLCACSFFFITILTNTIRLIARLKAFKDVKKEYLSKSDLNKYEEYYKDILKITIVI